MRWLRRDMWKVGIIVAGMLLLLVLMVWVPVSAAGADERTSGNAMPTTGTVQATPTVDVTVTALSKKQLTLQVEQLQNQLQNQSNWVVNNSTALIAAFTTLVVAFFGISQWAVNRRDERRKEREAQDKELEDRKAERERREEEQKRWLEDRKVERERRAEERFQTVVEGLSSEREEAKIGAAITLRTFLRPGYEQFYIQTFDLAVAHLRLPSTGLSTPKLSYALGVVFKEVFPLARSQNEEESPASLDARGIIQDWAYFRGADLKAVWMPQAALRKADLVRAKLNEANLSEALLNEANLSGADLSGADLSGANLSGADLEDALSLKDTNLRRVIGLTREQLEACKAKGAIIDEDSAINLPQSPVSPPSPLQSNDAQAPSAPPAQVSTPTPETDRSSTTSSKPSNGAQAPSALSVQGSTPLSDTGESSAPSSQTSQGV